MTDRAAVKIRTVKAGELIFCEGLHGMPCMYVVKQGHVDIFVTRDDKRVTLSSLGKGNFFGEMALISPGVRSASALAVTDCELHVIDKQVVDRDVENSSLLIRHILRSLIGKVKEKDKLLALQASQQPVVTTYAHLLELMAQAGPSSDRAERHPEGVLALKEIEKKARLLLGYSEQRTRTILKHMMALQLLTIESSREGGEHWVRFFPKDIGSQAQQLPTEALQGLGEALFAESELIEVDECAALVGVDRYALLTRLVTIEASEDIVAFRKAAILRLLAAKGKGHFGADDDEMTPAVFSVESIEFIDPHCLADALSQLNVYSIAKLLKAHGNPIVAATLKSALSATRQSELELALEIVEHVDAAEVEAIELRLGESIRQAMQRV